MQDFVVFVQAHWMLCALFVAILGYVLFEEMRNARDGDRISSQTCVQLMNREHALVWDVRSQKDYAAGHIVGSTSVSMNGITETFQALSQADRQKPLIVVCQQGIGAAKAAATLKGLGHKHVRLLQGGIKQWQADQLPLSSQ